MHLSFLVLIVLAPSAWPLTLPINSTIQADTFGSRSNIWQPKVSTTFQMILSGIVDIDPHAPSVEPDVEIYDVDLFNTPRDSVLALQQLGKKVICYFSAGTSEDWRPDYSSFPEKAKGAKLPDWPGERWLDIRKEEVFNVMKSRIKRAADLGCDAIDPDNMGR
jgi:hypothetical protein